MTVFTKRAIMQTFEEMLEELPFDRITVSAIVKRCQIGHNTFYYHYRDIYDLLDCWVRQELGQYITAEDDLLASLKKLMHACQRRKRIVCHIFNSLSRDRLEQYVFVSSSEVFLHYVCQRANGADVSPDQLQDIADFCCYAFFGFFLRFLWRNMESDVDLATDKLGDLFCNFIDDSIRNSAQVP